MREARSTASGAKKKRKAVAARTQRRRELKAAKIKRNARGWIGRSSRVYVEMPGGVVSPGA